MKPFKSLTRRGKIRRLRALAIDALSQYELEVASMRIVGMRRNALFRIRTTDGASYAVRICEPGWRTSTDLQSEAAWLQALSHDTDIGVPEPLPTRNGDWIARISAAEGSEMRHCLVTTWISGTLLGTRLTEANLYNMGILCARLHAHAADFSPPKNFTQRKMDALYAYGERDVLFTAACRDAFTPHTRDIFERTRARIEEEFKRLYATSHGLRVIHGDLHHNNIKINHGQLCPFDFEHAIWGYPVQDLAVALQGLMIKVKYDAFESCEMIFRAGYESKLEWPESYRGQIDVFWAGRMLWAANYVAQFERQDLEKYIDRLARQFEWFLETGTVKGA